MSITKMSFAASAALAFSLLAGASGASAQEWCSGPRGPAPCYVIADFMARQGLDFEPTRVLPRDGQIVAQIGQACGGEPRCMAIAWTTEEVSRCREGWGVPGGCFGPNGEIMRVINAFVPQHLQPNVIVRNIENDVRIGPGPNNDLVGRNGWVRKRLGF